MVGFGFGFGSHKNSSARYVALTQGNAVPLLAPSLKWNGTAGSGFETIPEDPVRLTAKPALRLIVPPNQYYTDEVLVGVMAGANDGGTLVSNMGLKEVLVHCEGNTWRIDGPSFQTFADANGGYRTYFGWWTILRHDGRNGHAQIFFEAVPNDETMQNRVIGPYQFSPQARLHDASVTVAATEEADFPTIAAALAHCRTNAFGNPLLTITQAGSYDIEDGAESYQGQGYCTITGATAGVRIAKPAYSTDSGAAIRTRYAGLRFMGANLTIDMKHISEIYSEPDATRSHWVDGCSIVNSAGQGALWRGIVRPVDGIVRNGGLFTECYIENCSNPFKNAKLARGSVTVGGLGDLYAGCPMVVGNTSTGHRADTSLAKDLAAISVRYGGAAAAATIDLSGGNAAAKRTVTVRIAGSADRTLVLDKSEAAYRGGVGYTLQSLVDWLNAIPDVTATLNDRTSGRAAVWLGLPGSNGEGFSARDIKAVSLALVTYVGVESTWWQASGVTDNVIVWGNLASGMVARDLDLAGAGDKRDFLFANNAIHNDKRATQSASLVSQFNGAHSHVICAHNTLSTQGISFRTDAGYSSGGHDLFANNSVRAIAWAGAAAGTSIVNNHIHAGQVAPVSAQGFSNVVGTTIGGDDVSLYADDKTGDFRARGALLTNLAVSVLRFNGIGESLEPIDLKGAFKAVPEETVRTASSVTQYGITYNFASERSVAQYPTGDWRVLGPVTIVFMGPASGQASGNFSDQGSYPLSWVHGAQVNPGNRSWVSGGVAANKDNQRQGLNGIQSITNYAGLPFENSRNQDPAATGQPLEVTTGSVMKFVSKLSPGNAIRPGGDDMAVLTVVDDLGPDNALRPGVAQADKTHHFTTDDWNLTAFSNLPKPAAMPDAVALARLVARAYNVQNTDTVNSENTAASNNQKNYPRELAQEVGLVSMALNMDFTPAEKIAMLNGLYGIAIDIVERVNEGGESIGGGQIGGNGSAWRKVALSTVISALEGADSTPTASAKLAEMKVICDYQQRNVFPEDKMIKRMSFAMIAHPRDSTPKFPKDEIATWMEGAYDFVGNSEDVANGGPNLDSGYRLLCSTGGIVGIVAVLNTRGAEALWNNPHQRQYYRSIYAEEIRFGNFRKNDTNSINGLDADIVEAFWPADPMPPAIVEAKVKQNVLWVRFDKALDMGVSVPATAYTVKVNGAQVAAKIAPEPKHPDSPGGWVTNGIFRTNIGLILPSEVISSDVVTVSYAGGSGTGKLRSAIDKVNVGAFTDRVAVNETPSVGGVNASYPIVRFASANPDTYKPTSSIKLGADAPRFTLWLPHIKLFTAPTATIELFGVNGNAPTMEISILSSRHVRVAPRDSGGVTMTQLETQPLVLGTAYSLRIDYDASDPSATTGWSAYLNGAPAKNRNINWAGGPEKAVGWSRSFAYVLGGTAKPYFDGEFGGLWLNTSQRVTDPAQVARFTSKTNGSLDIGTLGDGITGERPALFIMGNAEQYNDPNGVNRGTAAKFYRVSGGVGDLDPALSTQWR